MPDCARRRPRQAIAAYDATVANYRQTALTSFKEVEDNLAAVRILEEETKLQAEAVESARLSVQLTTNQYKAGIVSYLNVITVQTIALTDEATAIEIRGRRMAAAVLLVQALGGGWTAAELPSPADVTKRERIQRRRRHQMASRGGEGDGDWSRENRSRSQLNGPIRAANAAGRKESSNG